MAGASKSNGWSRADALFAAALELDASERGAFLRRECGEELQLRREVEELLDAAAAAESAFESLPGAIGATLDACISVQTGAPADAPEPEEIAGRRIGRYRVVRRLARGGMGSVYLAERADGAFRRRVALKLLRRGLDTDDILDRFRAERQILADLEHPNIGRLIDGGSTVDGRPYLVMEYVEGVPITDYCDERDLDLDARLRLFMEVCDAVHHAHGHGVVHRDLKPGNILVDRTGHAKLLDFGIARLLDPDARATHTRPGLRLLTPEYASPEQVCAGDIDARSDVYQLGLLLYELLTGKQPYRVRGRSVSDLERVVCREPVAPPSELAPAARRRSLRGDLDSIVLQALRKDPARRYASAKSLARDVGRYLDGELVSARSEARGYRLRRLVRRHRAKLGLAGASSAVLVAAALLTEGPPAAAPAPGSVAVLPFRVSGADPSLAYLREGMVDLLSTKLTGEGGPRAVAPATVIDAWQRAGGTPTRAVTEPAALAVARAVGAAQLLVGEVVGTPDRLIVNASLHRVPGGEVAARATVQGPADSLLQVVDELTAQLLVLGAGESHRPLGALATTSLPALRAHLDGLIDFRAARYERAYDHFIEAVELDSTFAVAAVRAWQAAWFDNRAGGQDGLLSLAWQNRDRLNDRDMAFVEAVLGTNYPAPSSDVERLASRRRLIDMAPDHAEYRYMYADRLYHWHAILDPDDGRERAAAQFRRALESDSAFLPTYEHLVPLLYSLGRSEEALGVAKAYFRRNPEGADASFIAWRQAVAENDSVALGRIRAQFDRLSYGDLLRIFSIAVHEGVEVDDATRVMDVLRRRGLTPAVRGRVLREDYILQLLRGRPQGALAAAERLSRRQAEDEGFHRLDADVTLVLSALYGDGDSIAAGRALGLLTARAYGPAGAPNPGATIPDLCTVAQWRLWKGDSRGVSRTIERLRAADRRGPLKDTGPVCAMLLEAIESVVGERPDAPRRLARVDSALASGPHVAFALLEVQANMVVARLYARLGEHGSALRAARRRVYDLDSTGLLLATSLRMEGPLAASVGDTVGAIRAYRHYLVLRSDPEPILRAQADSVRTALAALTMASAQR